MLKIVLPMLSTNPLQDAGWIGVIVAIFVGIATVVATVAITIWAVRKQRSRKEISYQIISDASIASINKEVKDRVKILFDGIPIEDMNLLVLKLWNSGNAAIKPEDYVEPIKFEFDGRKVASADILNMEPSDLIDPKDIKSFFTLELDSVKLPKFLLNPNEAISLKILLTGPTDKVTGRTRIVEGRIIEIGPNTQVLTIKMSSVILVSFPLLTLVISTAITINLFINSIIIGILAALALLIIILSILAFLFSDEISDIRKTGLRIRR